MEFSSENRELFLDMFKHKKELIRSFPGCLGLKLLNDRVNNCIFFTHSIWRSEEDLEKYRNSELFKETWAQTKTWFSAKPQAWSVDTLFNVESKQSA